MKNYLLPVLSIGLFILIYACGAATEKQSQKSIRVFGEPDCSSCLFLKQKLEENALTYTFHDVAVDSIQREVMALAQKSNIDPRGLRMPFVVIDNEFLMVPPIDSILIRL